MKYQAAFPRKIYFPTILLLLLGLLVLIGCEGEADIGEIRTQSETVSIQGAEQVDAQIRMGVGELEVSGGAEELLDADFTYNIEAWQPEVEYSVASGQGELTVRQPANIEFSSDLTNLEYRWELRFNNSVPLELDVRLGAGDAVLSLGGTQLRRLELQGGAGQMTLDLRGNWENDLTAAITGGVGNVNVLLPSTTGVRAEVSGGLGNLFVNGLHRDDGGLVNDSYGRTPHSILLTVQGAVGEVSLEVEE